MKRRPNTGEIKRLAALRAYGILDTPPEPGFEHITSLLTRLFQVPIAAVTLVDAERQWFKSIRGLEIRETPRNLSFCAHAMWGEKVMVVPDATLAPPFADNPLVTGESGLRFYAGAPLRTPKGQPLGALCVLDRHPRAFSPAEQQVLLEVAALVEDELLLRRVGKELRAETFQRRQAEAALKKERRSKRNSAGCSGQAAQAITVGAMPPRDDHFRRMIEQASEAMFVYDVGARILDVNTAACNLVGYKREELLRLLVGDIDVGFDPVKGPKRWCEMVPGEAITLESLHRRKDGNIFPTEARITVVETDHGRVLLALVRDISQRKKAEVLLQERIRQQQAVAELGAKALSGGNVDALLDAAVGTVAGTLDLEICRVLEHVPIRKELVTRAGIKLPAQERGARAASDSPKFAAGHVVRTGESVIIRNFRQERRFKITPWLKATGAVSGLTVPVGENDSDVPRYGILAAYTRKPREFSDDDVYFVQAVANILAAAIARQRVEDALQVVKARYRRIAANTPGVVYQYLVRSDGRLEIPFISESCRTLYGQEPHEIQAHPEIMLDRIHPEDRPKLEEAMRAAETTLTALHWQGRHLLPNGEVRWVWFDSNPERLPDASIICDGIIIDVTEEETRKQALRQSEERFRLANLLAPFPVMLYADDGEILQVNDAWTHLTGYLPEELTTLDAWHQRAHPTLEAQNAVKEHIAQLPQHLGAIECLSQPIRCANGEERLWDYRSANLGRLPDGRWLHITTAVDVTERHRNEVSLRLAKEEAERANAAKSVFLSRMSHELRTPLNAILGFGQVLEIGPLREQDDQSVKHILKGGRHLLSLIDEVLDLARVEAGEMVLRLAAVSFEKLAQECADLVARLAQARGITCVLETSVAFQTLVCADEQRLRQVLLNLLSNAIKYNRPGGKVQLGCERTGTRSARLKVSDTGAGISADGLSRLFVPFERLGQEFGEVEGSGLGLVVSKQLMEAMGGSLGVESEVDKGSTFWIELPTATNAAPPNAGLTMPAQIVPPGLAQVASATLLYIEDNASNVQVIKTVVERLRPHWRFLSATDGKSGLQQAREQLPSFILLDLQLPGMKGDEVLEALKKDAAIRHIPVLLLSADATRHSRERLLSLGATDYLSKPFKIAELFEKFDELLEAVS